MFAPSIFALLTILPLTAFSVLGYSGAFRKTKAGFYHVDAVDVVCIEFSGSFKQMGKAYTKASKECEKVDGLMESAYGYAEFTWNNEDEVSTDELRWCAGYLVNDMHKYADQILNNTNFRIVHVQPSEAIRITHKVRFKPFSYMIGYYKAKRMIKQLKKDMPDLKGNHIHASFVKWPPKLMEIHMFQTNTGVFEIDQDIIDNKT